MFRPVLFLQSIHRDQSPVRDHPTPDWLNVLEQARVPALLVDVVLEQLLADHGLDAVASDEQVAGRGRAVCELQEYPELPALGDGNVRV